MGSTCFAGPGAQDTTIMVTFNTGVPAMRFRPREVSISPTRVPPSGMTGSRPAPLPPPPSPLLAQALADNLLETAAGCRGSLLSSRVGPTLEVRTESQCTWDGSGGPAQGWHFLHSQRSPQSRVEKKLKVAGALPEGGRASGVGVQNSEPCSGAKGQLSEGRLASAGPTCPPIPPRYFC